jgi:alkylated DNA repair dioxygenase AlkB
VPSQQSLPFGGEQLPKDGSAVLIPDFLDIESADKAFADLRDTIPWEEQHLAMFGSIVPEPRLSSWHSDNIPYTYSGVTRTPRPFTPLLQELRERCSQISHSSFNSVLVNYYRNGNDHLGWHSDNEIVNGPEPVIASVSLGAERRFDFRHNDTGQVVKVLLPHGSLLVMSGLSQQCWQHRIVKEPNLTGERINLTFRAVLPLT